MENSDIMRDFEELKKSCNDPSIVTGNANNTGTSSGPGSANKETGKKSASKAKAANTNSKAMSVVQKNPARAKQTEKNATPHESKHVRSASSDSDGSDAIMGLASFFTQMQAESNKIKRKKPTTKIEALKDEGAPVTAGNTLKRPRNKKQVISHDGQTAIKNELDEGAKDDKSKMSVSRDNIKGAKVEYAANNGMVVGNSGQPIPSTASAAGTQGLELLKQNQGEYAANNGMVVGNSGQPISSTASAAGTQGLELLKQ
eukprot:CAMPEP_0114978854 /NCGR_PEP_ID=MMETSP0216-20121206/4044_1 /TAXON_ID=223996 /ORGANISM="Protocruzia adherens, Strain Boccale" /LENGTH=257 /DNA_ID=CAMNT_0002340109 /DNA_START=100 /DNA_END=871 /DNA_ORIENTATION=-